MTVVRAATLQRLTERAHVARRYLEQNDDREVSLSDLAQTAAVSKHHLARVFRALHGQPPARFHRELRLRRAAEQLAAGAMTTATAAERFGFSDAAAFCRAFKRCYAVPPGHYCGRRGPSGRAPAHRADLREAARPC